MNGLKLSMLVDDNWKHAMEKAFAIETYNELDIEDVEEDIFIIKTRAVSGSNYYVGISIYVVETYWENVRQAKLHNLFTRESEIVSIMSYSDGEYDYMYCTPICFGGKATSLCAALSAAYDRKWSEPLYFCSEESLSIALCTALKEPCIDLVPIDIHVGDYVILQIDDVVTSRRTGSICHIEEIYEDNGTVLLTDVLMAESFVASLTSWQEGNLKYSYRKPNERILDLITNKCPRVGGLRLLQEAASALN